MIIVSRIIHVKVDRRLNVANKFKYQRRLSSRLSIVMFRGTPCICSHSHYQSFQVSHFLLIYYKGGAEAIQVTEPGVNRSVHKVKGF